MQPGRALSPKKPFTACPTFPQPPGVFEWGLDARCGSVLIGEYAQQSASRQT